jgi:uncharacterized membrane protein YidH (DUF202 family)
MKKIILKLFIRIITLSIFILSFGKNVFGASAGSPDLENSYTAGSSLPPSPTDNIINITQLLLIFVLIPFSVLLAVFFYVRYFLVKNKVDDASKLKAKKFLKKANVCFIVLVLLVFLVAIFKYFATSF